MLVGRASIGVPPSFGVIAEALRSWLRTEAQARPPSVYDAGLQLVLPEWPADEHATGLTDSQVRLLAHEGVVALLRDIAASRDGLVLIVDDIHGADPESIEVLRYVVSAGIGGVGVVASSRPDESALADHLMATLAHQGLADLWPLEPLAGDRHRRPAHGAPRPTPARRLRRPRAHPGRRAASVRRGDGRCPPSGRIARGRRPRRGVARRSQRRAAHGGGGCRNSSRSAERRATRGRHRGGDRRYRATTDCSWPCRCQSSATVRAALVAAVDAGLIETVGGAAEFRHAVVGDAVRDRALPDVVRSMHQRAAAALASGVSVDDITLERIAMHLAAIGELDAAASALVDAATICGQAHALLRAESLARRAGALATSPELVDAASDALAAALAAQGRWNDALAQDQATTTRSGYSPDRWIRMARCALDERLIDVARELADVAGRVEANRTPFFDVTVGRLAVANGDVATALECAARALDESGDDAVTASAALDLRARARSTSPAGATRPRPRGLANKSRRRRGLTAERIRGLVSMAELELFDGRPPQRMFEAVVVARDAGALVEEAWALLNLSIALSIQGDPVEGARHADAAADLCEAHRLDLMPFALMARLGAATSSVIRPSRRCWPRRVAGSAVAGTTPSCTRAASRATTTCNSAATTMRSSSCSAWSTCSAPNPAASLSEATGYCLVLALRAAGRDAKPAPCSTVDPAASRRAALARQTGDGAGGDRSSPRR